MKDYVKTLEVKNYDNYNPYQWVYDYVDYLIKNGYSKK
jgi:hypothetical protein